MPNRDPDLTKFRLKALAPMKRRDLLRMILEQQTEIILLRNRTIDDLIQDKIEAALRAKG